MKSYVVGFGLAIILTLVSYVMVVDHLMTGDGLVWTLMGSALIQVCVQLYFFLHLGRDKKARWNVAAFWFMLLIVVILVAGSLWIMYHLNYNMSAGDMDKYMLQQSSKGF